MKINSISQLTGQAAESLPVGKRPQPERAKPSGTENSARVEINFPKNSQWIKDSKGEHFDDNKISGTLDVISKFLGEKQIDLSWSFDDKTNSIVIKFVDRETNKIIRQIPPDEILKLREHIIEMLGMIYDKKI